MVDPNSIDMNRNNSLTRAFKKLGAALSDPNACRKCNSYPCICGEEYKNLGKKSLLTLINSLLNIARDKYKFENPVVMFGNTPMNNIITGLGDDGIFTPSELEEMPKEWQLYIKCCEELNCREFVLVTCTKVKDYPLVAPMILTILVKCNISNSDVLKLVLDFLKSDEGNFVTEVLSKYIDFKSGTFESTISNLTKTQPMLINRKEKLLANNANADVSYIDLELDAISTMLTLCNAITGRNYRLVSECVYQLMCMVSLGELDKNENFKWCNTDMHIELMDSDWSFKKVIREKLNSLVLPITKII